MLRQLSAAELDLVLKYADSDDDYDIGMAYTYICCALGVMDGTEFASQALKGIKLKKMSGVRARNGGFLPGDLIDDVFDLRDKLAALLLALAKDKAQTP